MYIARFDAGSESFLTVAVGAPVDGAAPRGGWSKLLDAHPAVDAALRVRHGPEGRRALFLLCADAAAQSELLACRAALLELFAPRPLTLPDDAGAFDHLTGAVPSHQLRVSHDGYHHQGQAVACEFRLYAAELPADASTCYQVNLRRHRPGPESERRVRKHLAWLDLEQPFSDAVRAMQRALVQRLREPGWIADEYLAFADASARDQVRAAIERQFAATAGRVGFPEPPVEPGDFGDWMATGCHTLRDGQAAPGLPALGATMFSAAEADWLLASAFTAGASPGRRTRTPQVFISYASSDYARAARICESLEALGVDCWIAPRDIERDLLPYTEAITRSLAQVRAVVMVLSEMANLSVHIPRELNLALERKLPIVPVRVADVLPAGQLDYLLRTCQWLNAFDREWDGVVAELHGRLGVA